MPTLKELKELAREKQVKGFSLMSKEQLETALKKLTSSRIPLTKIPESVLKVKVTTKQQREKVVSAKRIEQYDYFFN